MAETGGGGAVNARIAYWGVAGAGKTTNLRSVFAKLRPDHRGDLQDVPTRLDPSVTYELLPIELGDVAGVRTQIQIIALPGASEHGPTRKQLMDQIDGVVLVVDSQRERIDENLAAFEELRQVLAAYGRTLDQMPLVIQYNKRDLADPYALEELHRKLEIEEAAVFETVATEGSGVLQTLSTISKKAIRALRDRDDSRPAASAAAAADLSEPSGAGASADDLDLGLGASGADLLDPEREPEALPSEPIGMEDAILAAADHPQETDIDHAASEAEALLDAPWERVSEEFGPGPGLGDVSIVSVGTAVRAAERTVKVPIVLGDSEGNTSSMVLTVSLDPLLEED